MGQRAARLRTLTRLAAEVGAVRAAIAAGRERVDRTITAEARLGDRQQLPAAERTAARDARWELERLEAELRRLRDAFNTLRYDPLDKDASPRR